MNTVIYFGSPMCSPCVAVKAELEKLDDSYEVEMYDVTEDLTKTMEYNVSSTPTLIYVQNDLEIGRTVGYVDLDIIQSTFHS